MIDSKPSSDTTFITLTMLAISLLLLLSWQLVLGIQTKQNLNAQKLQPQRIIALEESKKVQVNLEKIVVDLMKLSETDSDAKAIVDKNQIRRTSPSK